MLHNVKNIKVTMSWKNTVKKGYGNLYSENVYSNLLMKVAAMETAIYSATVENMVPLEFIKYLPLTPPFPLPLLASVLAGKGKPPRLVDMALKKVCL
jgi:tetrahydromethanopterin S-methyltransferase subunit E